MQIPPPMVQNVIFSPQDRYILCRCEVQGISYSVISVYMPTSDNENLQLEIINEIADLLDREDDSNIILTGDFNVVMDQYLDRSGYVGDRVPNARFQQRLIQVLDQLDLSDIWRSQFPDKRTFTWSRNSKLARLDYVFIQIPSWERYWRSLHLHVHSLTTD